jgi:hypothetical protein
MAVEYPVFDTYGDALIRTIGSFWYNYFNDRDALKEIYRAEGHRQGQVYLDYLTTVASISRFNIPVFSTQNWYLLTLRQSDKDRVTNIYGQEALVYGGGAAYGAPQTQATLFPLPDDEFFGELAQLQYTIYNRVVYPSKTWTAGLDVEVDRDRGVLRFRDDPFDSEYVARRDVIDESGDKIDEEIGLWMYKGEFDLDLVYKHWGFAVGLQLQSSQFYKDIVNALWDMYVVGSNMAGFEQIFSASLGIPLVIEPVETVETITVESDRQLVITDKNVYSFSVNANIVVTVGDELVAGQAMADDLKIIDLSGNDVDTNTIPALAFGSNFLSGGYFAELTFENRSVTLEYLGLDEDNKAVVTFEVGGFPGDVDLFFEKAQLLGKQSGGQTLAELLDLRDHPVGQPLPMNLPTTINPLEFALDNIMKNHLVLVKVRTPAILDDAPGLTVLRYMRNVIPPHMTFIVYVEVAPDVDTIDLGQAGDEETPGAEDTPTMFDGILVGCTDSGSSSSPDPIECDYDEVGPKDEVAAGEPAYEDVALRVYKVSEVCEGLTT